jgi:flagella basal body P-ring formation protein FlgA
MAASLVLALVAACGPAAAATPAAPAAVRLDEVRAAIVRAVQERVGEAVVTIDGLQVRGLVSTAGVRAVPDAGSRLGGPVRFVLHAGGASRTLRAGSADAIVHVRLPHVRATRAIAPGVVLAPADFATVDGDPGRIALRTLPAASALVGAKARRAIAADGAIAADAVTAAPLVRSGDEVATMVRVGPVVAQSRATALEDGALGAIVRLQIEKRRLRGRVRGAGEVEITP